MPLAARFPTALDRIKRAFVHLDTNLKSHFTPLREQQFGNCYEDLCKQYPEKSIDQSLMVKWNKGTSDWRVAVRTYSLVYLVDAVAKGDTSKVRSIVKSGRAEIDHLNKKSISELDQLTKDLLGKFRLYAKFDDKITKESESYKGICMGFVVRWISYQILNSGAKGTGTKFLEKDPSEALRIEDSHIQHGKKVTSSEDTLLELKAQDLKVRNCWKSGSSTAWCCVRPGI